MLSIPPGWRQPRAARLIDGERGYRFRHTGLQRGDARRTDVVSGLNDATQDHLGQVVGIELRTSQRLADRGRP
jgi:hypothetical protein